MLSLSNGFSSDENVKKRRLENGFCSSSGVSPKWKPRKVSSVRDFPPGCGPNDPPINIISQEAAAALVVTDSKADAIEANGVVSSLIAAESVPHERVTSLVNCELENNALGLSKKLHEAEAEAEFQEEGFQAVVKVAARDVEVEALAKEEVYDVEVHAMVKSVGGPPNNSMLEISGVANGLVQVGSVKPLSPPQGSSSNGNIKEGTGLKNKYRQRRVSAVRDFPPFCGLNPPEPTEADRLRINGNKSSGAGDKVDVGSGRLTEATIVGGEELERIVQDGTVQKSEPDGPRSKSLTVIQKSDEDVRGLVLKGLSEDEGGEGSKRNARDATVHKSEPEEFGAEPRSKLHTIIQKNDKDVRGQVGREIVVYSRDKLVKRRPSDDASGFGGEVSKVHVRDETVQKSESEGIATESRNKSHDVIQESDEDIRGQLGKVGREKPLKRGHSDDANELGCKMEDMVIVQGLMAAPNCPWRQGKEGLTSPDDVMSKSKVKRHSCTTPKKSKESNAAYIRKFVKGKLSSAGKAAYGGTLDLVVRKEEDFVAHNAEQSEDSPAVQGPHDLDVSLPPFGPKSSSDARNRVREILRLFQVLCRKLLQGEEAKIRERYESKSKHGKRIDLAAAKIVGDKIKDINKGKQYLGTVPGVEVGDEFQYRVELALVGVHRLYQAGIDYIKHGKEIVTASIVASGAYDDELDNPDCLIYSGSGGIGKDKQPEDQKLERGNLALKNSISLKNPVRVIRGSKDKATESSDARSKLVVTYVYDGLYTVERYWQDPGPHGKLVFKFELRRIPGQPELAWKEVKKSKKFKTRDGLCVDDITGGKEFFPICAVNTIDNEKPPPFNYITRMIYPDWYRPIPPKGCDCAGGCYDKRCSCAFKNGGEIPYNHNGAIVEAKTLVYECGPSCKCSPSCYNRVTQHGMKIQLEIFKTESRGWGVRSLNSIPSGSFICEYIGELLEDTEAEKRTGNDEYLFDIGKNYSDCSLNSDAKSLSSEVMEDGGFTIDAAESGNVGRFINHSCSPNLYAQNVLHDQEDKRMPHIMFFAAENIPPLQELTYHYNYAVDTVRDFNGNIKIKRCYCGSTECTGRMY